MTESGLLPCRAKGAFRYEKTSPVVGDLAEIITEHDSGSTISSILPRKNILIRPPMANLDILFITLPCAEPSPSAITADKMTAICERNKIEPVIVLTKCELDFSAAEEMRKKYELCGYKLFVTSSYQNSGICELRNFITLSCNDKISAFAGVSGAGKSTLINMLFPSLKLETGNLSKKIMRGKNTTRQTILFPLNKIVGEADVCLNGYFADTPGFSLIDFEKMTVLIKEELPELFREFEPFVLKCRYTKCSHTKEEGCSVIEAVNNNIIPKSRHESYCTIYEEIKNVKKWELKNETD